MLDLLKTLRELEQIETKMAELYEWYATLFAGDEEASTLFCQLQMEEISHQNILRYESRIVRGNPKAFRQLVFDTALLSRTLEAVDQILHADRPPTLEEALATALEFESGAAELYYISVFRDMAQDFAHFVTNLHAGSRTHFERLHRFAARKGIVCPTPAPPALQPPERPVEPDPPGGAEARPALT